MGAGRTRIGILGGTFDPPHAAHVLIALVALESAPLDRVLVVPGAVPPHGKAPLLAAADRLALAEAAFAGLPRVEISTIELERAADQDQPSWTIDTVELLQAQHADAQLVLIVGADQTSSLAANEWHRTHDLLACCELAVARRPGTDLRDLDSAVQRLREHGATVHELQNPLVEVSSTALRRALAAADEHPERASLAAALVPGTARERLLQLYAARA